MALIGDLTTVAQLIGKISDAVSTARNLPQVCRRFAVHLKDIGRHLEPLKSAELDEATRQTLANLQRTLERSYDVIVDCSRRSYAYRLIRGKSIRDKIKEAQDEVDRILRLFPLIQLSQDYGYRPSYGSSDGEEDAERYDSEDEYSDDEEPRSGKIVEEYVPKFRELSLNANANVNQRLNEEWVDDDDKYDHEELNGDDDHEESDDDDDDHEESNDNDDDRQESNDDDDDREESDDDNDDREESDDDDREESDEDEYHPHYIRERIY